MTQNILTLPPEVQEEIFSYFQMPDITNFACCAKAYFKSIQHLMWYNLCIRWDCIKRNSTLPKTKKLTRLKHTKHLNFINDNDSEFPPGPRRWHDVARNYKKVLTHCDHRRLINLYIEGLIIDESIKLTSVLLSKLEVLLLENCYYITDIGWNSITSLICLKDICLYGCCISDSGIKELMKLICLEEFSLISCNGITDVGIKHISGKLQLKKIAVVYNEKITPKGLEHIGKLVNIENLNLGHSSISDDVLVAICMRLIRLKNLDVTWCENLTDCGLIKLITVTSLEKLNIQNNSFSKEAIEKLYEVATRKQMKLIV